MMPGTGSLRILHLANSVSDRGNGIVNVAVDLAVEQARRGLSVTFASGGGGFTSLLESAGVRCVTAPQSGMRRVLANSLGLRGLLRMFRPDIVHAHMRSGLALAWPWSRLLGIPLIMHLHNVHDRSHGLLLLPSRVIAVSNAVRTDLILRGVKAERISVVLNGTLGSARLKPFSGLPAELGHPAVVTVAGLMHRKGIAELIEAFSGISAEYPAVHLYIVGGGDELEYFQMLAGRSGVSDRIHFEGFHPDPRPWLKAADVFVLASRRESFGLAVLEAREAGCAIIATNVDGIPELLDRGRCGILVPPNDPAALAEQMGRLLGDQDLRQRLRSEAQLGLGSFTVSRMTDEVLNVYRELLPRTRRSGALQGVV
jgi:glycosyltransferase involved in cell wall biosynthesis